MQTFPIKSATTVYGTKFHSLARQMTAALRTDPSADDADHDALLARLYDLSAAQFLDSLLADGKVDSAAELTTAFHAFCARLLELRGLEGQRRGYAQIFLKEEFKLTDVVLDTAAGNLYVSGAIDCLRLHPSGEIEVVDYKLTRGEALDKELIQIALYRKLLLVHDPHLKLRGVLEYFLPALSVTWLEGGELDAAYRDVVAPVLGEITAARRSASTAGFPKVAAPVRPSIDTEVASTAKQAHGLKLGETSGYGKEPVELRLDVLLRHTAILGGSGSGKTTLALNLIEQSLDAGVPALLVDRKGDLARYADATAWQVSDTAERSARRRALWGKLDVALFTPGHSAGRPLRLAVVPDTKELDPADRQQLYRTGAQSLGDMLRLKRGASDEAKRALLVKAIELLSEHRGSTTVQDIVDLLQSEDPGFLESAGMLAKERERLLLQLESFRAMNHELLRDDGEPLDSEYLLGLGAHAVPGKTRLCIVSTRFFDSDDTALFWLAQLLSELNRFAARKPSQAIQAVVMFDEADLYLPATRQPATKGPMESLLKRARSAGLGMMLATQSPGDLDYKCRENILTWIIGRVKEPVALEKLKPLAGAAGLDPGSVFPKQKLGHFYIITEDKAKAFISERSLLDTEQMPEKRILEVARSTLG